VPLLPKAKPRPALIEHYMGNAQVLLREAARSRRAPVFGGENAPYVWVGCPSGISVGMFDKMLNEAHVVITPGSGFGSPAKVTSASPPSTAAPTSRKSAAG
jgi:aspartate/methionine/tyrosine aminotransferase